MIQRSKTSKAEAGRIYDTLWEEEGEAEVQSPRCAFNNGTNTMSAGVCVMKWKLKAM